MLDVFAEHVGAEAEQRRPEDGAGSIGNEEARPRHAIDAGEERGEHPEKGDEAAEEHDLAAMLHEEILADLDARLGQADVVPIANEHGKADLPPDPIADIVADDGAGRSRGDDLGNIEAAGLAGINGCGNKYRLAWQRHAHAFQADHPGYRK